MVDLPLPAASTGPTVEERDITFTNGNVRLPGTLLLPRAGNDLPAVVFLHGSGAEGRWASRYLATQMASRYRRADFRQARRRNADVFRPWRLRCRACAVRR